MEHIRQAQRQRILEYLKEHGSITQREASDKLGADRLSARICELQKMGHPIKTDLIAVKDRFGDTGRIARYTLEKEVQPQ